MSLLQAPARHPNVPFRRVPLTEQQAEIQHQRGLYTVQGGVWLPIPVDHVKRPTVFLNRDLWRQDAQGRVFRPGTRMTAPRSDWQHQALAWLRDHVHEDIPALYYRAVLGHDLHVSMFGDLYARHFHAGWANPFEPDRFDVPPDSPLTHDCDKPWCPIRDGKQYAEFCFIETLGWLSGAKVTDKFINETTDELASAVATEFADFDSHEVGTSSQAEDNNDTALIPTSGIARAAGTPSSTATTYVSVGTITADATESWEEHGLFNNTTGAALMDRSLTGGQAVNSSDQVEYTYTITLNPEA